MKFIKWYKDNLVKQRRVYLKNNFIELEFEFNWHIILLLLITLLLAIALAFSLADTLYA